jgi:2EXR family
MSRSSQSLPAFFDDLHHNDKHIENILEAAETKSTSMNHYAQYNKELMCISVCGGTIYDPRDVSDTFTFELPDPEQQLFFQYPNTFHCSPKFPLEIRLMIWRMTFQPCRLRWVWGNPFKYHVRNIPVPVATRVNRESRCEGLKCYTILNLRSEVTMSFPNPQPLRRSLPRFWNSNLDIVSIPHSGYLMPNIPPFSKNWHPLL